MNGIFVACKAEVHNRGAAPDSFLDELVQWGQLASDDIFVPNARHDIYAVTAERLGPWTTPLRRKAAMLEVLRVLGGFESSWNWLEGRDENNEKSNTPCTEEAGIFQCSGDSMGKDPSLKALVLKVAGATDCDTFRSVTKANHAFAIEYCARLLRVTTAHHGPIRDNDIQHWLRRNAMEEFEGFLGA